MLEGFKGTELIQPIEEEYNIGHPNEVELARVMNRVKDGFTQEGWQELANTVDAGTLCKHVSNFANIQGTDDITIIIQNVAQQTGVTKTKF